MASCRPAKSIDNSVKVGRDKQTMNLANSCNQYCFELNEHDVLCGRGSGPNDRVGNVEFRNLVLSRKAEYLAAPSRDAKGRIATEIVDTVRLRGGRFLRKLSPAQAKEAGFKRGTKVYELADEGTVLEKAKQTLRQNRAEFVKTQGSELNAGSNTTINVGNSSGGKSPAVASAPPTNNPPVAGFNPDSSPHAISSDTVGVGGTTSAHQHNNGHMASSLQGSLNPYPLDASVDLDSMQRPNLSASTAQQLERALFANSNLSSVTNPPSITSSAVMNVSNTGSKGGRNDSMLSINTADILTAMGGLEGSMQSQDWFPEASIMSQNSTTSAQAFGALLHEYDTGDNPNTAMMQQYEQLKAQQQQLAMLQMLQQQQQQQQQGGLQAQQQQQALLQSFQPNNLQYIPEGSQQKLPFQQQQYYQQQQQQQPNNKVSSLREQYDVTGNYPLHMSGGSRENLVAHQHMNRSGSSSGGMQRPQQNQPQQNHTWNFSEKQGSTSNGDGGKSFITELSPEHQQKLLMQFQQAQAQNNNLGLQQAPAQNFGTYRETTSETAPPVMRTSQIGTELLQPLNDLLAPLNDTHQVAGSSIDRATSLLNYQPANNPRKEGFEPETISENRPTFNPNRPRRPSRRSTLGRDNRTGSSINSSKSSGKGLPGEILVEPSASTDSMNLGSMNLSFSTANKLVRALDDSAVGVGSSWLLKSGTSKASTALDASMLSLMSMSLTEIHAELKEPPPQGSTKPDNINEKDLKPPPSEHRRSSDMEASDRSLRLYD